MQCNVQKCAALISIRIYTLYIIKHTILTDISPETASFSLFLPVQKQ